MSLGKTHTIALVGLAGHLVEVQADIGQELPNFVILGLPDASLNEAKDRIRSAARNVGLPLSRRKLTVNLTPASLPKRGTMFDLAILVAAWEAGKLIKPLSAQLSYGHSLVFLAEIALDGRLMPVRGILPAVMSAVRLGYQHVVVGTANAKEAALVPGAIVHAFADLAQLAGWMGVPSGYITPVQYSGAGPSLAHPESVHYPKLQGLDLSDIRGQEEAKTALEIAAAGAHHLFLVGEPGAGKTMIAERLPSILPDLSEKESVEVSAIHSLYGTSASPSATGELLARGELISRPHCESPHHSASMAAIVGGGAPTPMPGAISRAHRGVLFLDEAPEFDRRVIESLRQPLESGELTIHRARAQATYPARFQLVLAANPCPCGMGSGQAVDCRCTYQQRRRYLNKLSGPILDRVDLRVQVSKVPFKKLILAQPPESSTVVRARVAQARESQQERLSRFGYSTNQEVPGTILRAELKLPATVTAVLDRAMERGLLSARGYDKTLRIAWTFADIAGATRPSSDHLGMALLLRGASQAAA